MAAAASVKAHHPVSASPADQEIRLLEEFQRAYGGNSFMNQVVAIKSHWASIDAHPKKEILKNIFQKSLSAFVESAWQMVQEVLANPSTNLNQAKAHLGYWGSPGMYSLGVQNKLTSVLTNSAELENEIAYAGIQALLYTEPVCRVAANCMFEKLAAREKTPVAADPFRALKATLLPHQQSAIKYLQATMPDSFAKFGNDLGPAQQPSKSATASQSNAKENS